MGPTDEQWAVRTRCVKENSEDVGCAILGESANTVAGRIKYICAMCVRERLKTPEIL